MQGNGFFRRDSHKRKKKKFSTNTNLNWRPLWASKKSFTGRTGEVPHSLFSKQHHITSFCESWVMAYFHCFYLFFFPPPLSPLILPVWCTATVSEKYHLLVFSEDFCCTEYSLEGKYYPNVIKGVVCRENRNAFRAALSIKRLFRPNKKVTMCVTRRIRVGRGISNVHWWNPVVQEIPATSESEMLCADTPATWPNFLLRLKRKSFVQREIKSWQ